MLEMKRGNHTPYEDMEEDAPIEETRDTFFIKAIPDAAYDKLVEETVHRLVKLPLIQHIKSVYQTPTKPIRARAGKKKVIITVR